MAFCVCGGAVLSCSFGAVPAPLIVLPASRVITVQAIATIMDQIPMVNITPFGACSCPGNPAVAAATAAALGVPSPMPCIPMPAGSWLPGSQTVLMGGKPALTDSSKLICAYGGIISINFSGCTSILTG